MIEQIQQKIENVLLVIGGPVTLAVMGLLTALDVMGRYLFNFPIYGAVELSTIAMGFIVYLCLGWGEREGGNIRVDFFLNLAKGRTRAYWEGILNLVCLIFFSIWSWRIVLDTISAVRVKQAMMATTITFPIWPSKIAIAVGMIVMTVRYFIKFLSRVHKFGK